MDQDIAIPPALLAALGAARHVAVLTGAGMSAESGVPTFRDAQTGLWARYRPEELATPEAFAQNPGLVWSWYQWRAQLCLDAQPNAGHVALAALAKRFARFTLTTQNVDGMHQRAGSEDVLELHGNLHRFKCFDTGRAFAGALPATPEDQPPRHPETGGMLRPDVVWFGEALPEAALMDSLAAAHDCSVFFTIGTSALVYPAAQLPQEALRKGAVVVEVNPAPTPFSVQATHCLRGPSGVVLPRLLAALS